jgi:hypothetical protein
MPEGPAKTELVIQQVENLESFANLCDLVRSLVTA